MAARADSQEKRLKQEALERFSDWRWRLDNLYWITDKDGRRVKFRMNWAQERLFDGMHYLNIILKARQIGFSTFIQLFMLDACLFNSNIRAGVIAHTREDAEAIFADKVKFPYDNLPEGLREALPATQDSARSLRFGNNSGIRVGTSLRSGTLQYLHVSEHGKICAKYPDKAAEIKTGALNTVQAGQVIFIESTAEGQAGDFFDLCEAAQAKQRKGASLTELDFKFHFFPWWRHPEYQMREAVSVPAPMQAYFEKLATQGIGLTAEQQAWYVKKAEVQGSYMKREYPSTPEEAFEAAVEGAYYAEQLAKAETEGRVGRVPHDPALRVETWWDLGIAKGADTMAIWFVQRNGKAIQVIDYFGDSGEGLAYYARVLEKKVFDHGYLYSQHLWPHDGKAKDLSAGKPREQIMADLGFKPEVQPDHFVSDGIEAVRNLLAQCWFDEERCAAGLRALKAYRKEWDDARGTWKDKPYHDWASHPADAFRTGAMADAPSGQNKPIDYSKHYPQGAFA